MNNQFDLTGLLLLCVTCLVPFVAGCVTTIIMQKRLAGLGLPWAFLPGGSVLKQLWERWVQ